MKVALVFPPFYFEPLYNLPPLGLINLATILKSAGHHVRIFEFPLAIRQKNIHMGRNIYTECSEQVLEFKPDLAAFSVQCTTYPPALRIAQDIRKTNPAVRIVFGGHNAAFTDALTLQSFPFVDAIVRGEGELTFPELVRGFEDNTDLGSIEGITFRNDDRVVRNPDRPLIEDLDSLPYSDYSFVPPPGVYRDVCEIRRAIAILEVGRGCPHHCIYCSQSPFWHRRSRTFSIERLIAEMRNLRDEFGAECFLLAYDQFTASRAFAEEFCRRMIDEGLHYVPWYCISRLDTVDDGLLKLMRKAGCESMCYGIDSGSRKTLSFIRKKIDRDLLLQRVSETTAQGIVPTLSFVIGFPEERIEDVEDTLKLALQSAISGSTNILVQMATILPGTDLYNRFSGLLKREIDTYFSLGIEFDDGKRLASDDAIIDANPDIFCSFYNLPCPAAPLRDLNDIASYFSIMASLYPRSFMLLHLELECPVTELFFTFLRHIEGKTGDRAITPQNCFAHFETFAAGLLDRKTALSRTYIPEIIRYETCLLKAGKLEMSDSCINVDLSRAADFKPFRNEGVLVERFTYNLPMIIVGSKCGRFAEQYEKSETFLIFRQLQGQIDVKEINEFGLDFLKLCNGTREIDAIAADLYPKYGAATEIAEFSRLCAEAAGVLSDLFLLLPDRIPKGNNERR